MSGPSSRMLALLSLLQLHHDWQGDQFAGRLEVNRRTIRRDISRLRELGYSVQSVRGPAGGYRLTAVSYVPALVIDEQAVPFTSTAAVAPSSVPEVADPATLASEKVRPIISARLRHGDAVVADVVTTVTVRVDPDVLIAVSQGVNRAELLEFDYEPDGDLGASRRVEPRAVVLRQDRWYLLAWDSGYDDWWIFSICQMRLRTRSRVRFVPRAIPGRDAAAFVAARFQESDRGDA